MVYSNKFVMCVLVDGQIQEELKNGQVPIPFNSEYTLRFRNKNNQRVVVKFYIDGEDVSGSGYIIPANSYIDIKRHSNTDKSFKFVPLDSEDVIDQGKNGINLNIKGLIEAKFYLEKTQKNYQNYYSKHKHWNDIPKDFPSYIFTNTTSTNFSPYTITHGKDSISLNPEDIEKINVSLNNGVTVQGSKTGQTFSTQYLDLEDDYVSLILFLKGFNKDKSFELSNEYKVIERQNQELKEKIKNEQEKLKIKELIEENKKLKEELKKLMAR